MIEELSLKVSMETLENEIEKTVVNYDEVMRKEEVQSQVVVVQTDVSTVAISQFVESEIVAESIEITQEKKTSEISLDPSAGVISDVSDLLMPIPASAAELSSPPPPLTHSNSRAEDDQSYKTGIADDSIGARGRASSNVSIDSRMGEETSMNTSSSGKLSGNSIYV
jgi:hypothetical protein